jgi:hypothetical protein
MNSERYLRPTRHMAPRGQKSWNAGGASWAMHSVNIYRVVEGGASLREEDSEAVDM